MNRSLVNRTGVPDASTSNVAKPWADGPQSGQVHWNVLPSQWVSTRFTGRFPMAIQSVPSFSVTTAGPYTSFLYVPVYRESGSAGAGEDGGVFSMSA